MVLCARQLEKTLFALKLIRSACKPVPMPASKRNWLHNMAATIAYLADSAQRTRSVLIPTDRPKAVELTGRLPSKLVVISGKLLSSATYYKESENKTR